MPRLTWLADELRKAGLRVVEVPGWETRGSSDFHPEGMTWHATAGSRHGTPQDETRVILNGSSTAPPPIAQLMLWRDGTVYVCAAGRCNHNKVGWDGPNKGLGNSRLLGIEMANDNRGEPWPAVQLDAARRATAAILKRLGADPMRRLAAHYEHQPWATRPQGEGSTKSDPAGVRMVDERPRVAALMRGDDDMTTKAEFVGWLKDPDVARALTNAVFNVDNVVEAPGQPKPGKNPDGTPVNTHWAAGSYLRETQEALTAVRATLNAQGKLLAALVAKDPIDEAALAAALAPLVAAGLPAGATPVSQDALEAALRAVFAQVGQA